MEEGKDRDKEKYLDLFGESILVCVYCALLSYEVCSGSHSLAV